MKKILWTTAISIAVAVPVSANNFSFLTESAVTERQEASKDLPLAIGGYDPTLYFAGGLPKPGNAAISYSFEGQLYYFANYESRQSFINDPKKFAPQYAGHCAFAMSEHQTAAANPTVFTIQDDKLFLFENEMKLEMWKTNSRKFRILADKRWELEAKNFSKFRAEF